MRRVLLIVVVLTVGVFPAGARAAATFNVTKVLDTNDGHCTATDCSLRDAIIASDGQSNPPGAAPNVINLKAGHYKLTLAGVNEDGSGTGDLDAFRSVEIRGAGARTTIIDGNHIDRVFDVYGNASFSATGVTVTGGAAVPASSGDFAFGGAVYNEGSGSVTFSRSAINDNTASGGVGGFGAGIDSAGPVTLTDTTASGNHAGGPTASQPGSGALISLESADPVTLTRVTATDNHAGGSGSNGSGGVLYATDSHVTATSSTLSGNTAGGASGGISYGGAIDVKTATITDSTFRGNHVGGQGGSGFGGAIDMTTGTLTDSLVSGNTAGGGVTQTSNGYGYGGGIIGGVTAVGSTISGNTAGGGNIYGYGGGVYSEAATSFTDSTISGNIAGGGGSNGLGRGGGIDSNGATAVLSYSDVVGNGALPGSSGYGGGIAGPFTSRGSIVAENSAGNGSNCTDVGTSQGHNLENGTSCGFTETGDLNASPGVASLANNGGPTPTLRLTAGSPAINHGETSGCPATDQRGVVRPVGPACDIGSYEVSAVPSVVTGGSKVGRKHHVTLSGSASNHDLVAGAAFFVFGKTKSYGSKSSGVAVPANRSAGVSIAVGGLAAGRLYHYRLVVSTPDGTSFGSDRTFRTPPAPGLSKVHVKRSKSGFTVSYADSQAGSVTFTVLRDGKKVRSFKHSGKAGHHKLSFGTGLPPGAYKLELVAHDSFGSGSHAVVKGFRVK